MNEPPPDLCPHPDDPLMGGAWASCLNWAIRDARCRRQFELDTGRKMTFPRSVLDAMIDQATGYDSEAAMHAYVHGFIVWFNENVWGDPNAPDEEDE